MSTTLHGCTRCDGFVPAGAARCPHCNASLQSRRGRKLLRAAVAVTLGGAFAATLMACYGCPGTCGPVDSGTGNDDAAAATDASGDASAVQEGGATNP